MGRVARAALASHGTAVAGRRPAGLARALAIGLLVALLQAGWGFGFSHAVRDDNLGDDEGIALMGAERILAGQVPYRDFFMFVGPLTAYVTAAGFSAFGASMLTARCVLIGAATLATALIYALARRLLGPVASGLAAGLYALAGLSALPILNHHWLATVLSLAAIVAALPWVRQPSATWPAVAGVLAAMATLTVQTTGCGLGLALLAWLLLVRPGAGGARAALWLLAGALAVILPVFALFAQTQALPALAYHLVAWPATRYVPVEATAFFQLPSQLRLPWLADRGTAALLGLALITTTGWSLWSARHVRRPRHAVMLLLGLATAAALAASLTRPNGTYLFVRVLPFGLPLAFAWWRQVAHRRGGGSRLAVAPLALAALLLAHPLATWRAFAHGFDPTTYAVDTPRGRLYAESSAGAVAFREALAFVQAQAPPGGPAWAGPYLPTLAFLSARPSPVDIDFLVPAENGPQHVERVARALDRARPRAVVWAPQSAAVGRQFDDGPERARFLEGLAPIQALLDRCYRPTPSRAGAVQLLVYDPGRCG